MDKTTSTNRVDSTTHKPFFGPACVDVVGVEVPESRQLVAAHLDDLAATGLQVVTDAAPSSPKR